MFFLAGVFDTPQADVLLHFLAGGAASQWGSFTDAQLRNVKDPAWIATPAATNTAAAAAATTTTTT